MAGGVSSGGFEKSEQSDIEVPEEVEIVLEELLKGLQDRVSPSPAGILAHIKRS